jgi:hypothetical protein
LEFLELELVLGGLLGHGFSRRYTCKTQRLRKWRNFDSEKKMREERSTVGEEKE